MVLTLLRAAIVETWVVVGGDGGNDERKRLYFGAGSNISISAKNPPMRLHLH